MNVSGNTILITGGTSGIGFEFATQFLKLGKDTANGLEDISREIETDLVGPVRTVKQFLPHLKAQEAAAIVNVSPGLAFIPFPISPIYCAAKAGVHSFTQSLRVQLENTRIKVFELGPPMTQTPLLTGNFHADDVKGVGMMDVAKMVGQAIKGLENNRLEIRPGLSNVLKLMSRIVPQLILNRLSKPVEAMLAQA